MPTTVDEFENDTAFERYVLARGTPLLPPAQGSIVIDLGDINSAAAESTSVAVHVGAADSSRSVEEPLSTKDLSPLVFGAAWKVLDLLVKLRLEQAGIRDPNRKSGYSISFKTKAALAGNASPPPPFDARTDMWMPVMKCYASTEALRHSLVHRRLAVDPMSGDISATTRPGEAAPKPLTADEQSAFCRVADGVAEAVIKGELSRRFANQLRWVLDQLAPHHEHPPFGISRAQGLIPLVIVRPSLGPTNEVELDFAHIRDRAGAAVKDVSYYDLEIHLPNNEVLVSPLEDTPNGRVKLSIISPPDWIRSV